MWHRSVEEQGFAIIPAVLADRDTSKLEQAFTSADVPRRKAGVRHALKYSAVAEIAHDERLLEIARRVLETGAVPFRATLFDKSPNSNWLVVWHQDTALPLCERHETPGWGPWSVKDCVLYAQCSSNRSCSGVGTPRRLGRLDSRQRAFAGAPWDS